MQTSQHQNCLQQMDGDRSVIDSSLQLFLGAFPTEPHFHLTAINGKGVVGGETYAANDDDHAKAVVTKARQWNAKGANVYFSVNAPSDARSYDDDGWPAYKLNKSHIGSLRAVWADLDPIDALEALPSTDPDNPAMTGRALEKARLQGLAEAIRETDFPPSIAIDSGNGVQLIWLFDEAVEATDEAKAKAEAIGHRIEAALGGTENTSNVDRVLRVPGTTNFPNKKKLAKGREPVPARLLYCGGPHYAFDKLDEMASAIETEIAPTLSEEGHIIYETPTEPNVRQAPTPLDPSLPPAFLALLTSEGPHGTKLRQAWNGAKVGKGHDDTHSSRDVTLMNLLKRKLTPEDLEAVLRAYPHGQMGRAVEPKMGKEADRRIAELLKMAAEANADNIDATIEAMNAQYFVATMSGNVSICTWAKDPAFDRDMLQLMKTRDFHLKYMHQRVLVGLSARDDEIWKTKAEAWLQDRRRRSYNSVTMSTAPVPADVLNLWRGFGFTPKAGEWPTIQEHLQRIICNGNERDYAYLERLLAYWMQNPISCGEVAVVLRGKKGTGKGAFARFFERAFKHHTICITQPQQFVGNFNAHLADCCFCFVDEALWAGDKQAEGQLKALVNRPTITIEPKGINAYDVPNRLKIVLASNSDWVIPASEDERRYFVLDVSKERMGDLPYFKKLFRVIDGAEGEAFLHHLLKLDLTGFDHREVPHTDGLNRQKLLSGDSFQKWWMHSLYSGTLNTSGALDKWPTEPITKSEVYDSYLAYGREHNDRYPLQIADFFARFYEVAPSAHSLRPKKNNPERKRMIGLQGLDASRAEFLTFMRIDAFDWGDEG